MPSRRAPSTPGIVPSRGTLLAGTTRRSASGASLVAALGALASIACAPAPDVGPSTPGGGVAETYSAIAEEIFLPRCGSPGCHGGNPPPEPPALDPSIAHEALVGVPSAQSAAGLNQVEPFDPERSYLVVKLLGEGEGRVMPPEGPLPESEIAAIEAWIRNGAPND